MHIVDIPAYFYPHVGGIENVVWESCIEWVKRGHDVTIVSSRTGKASTEEINEGVKIVRVKAIKILDCPLSVPLFSTLKSLPKIDIIRLHYPHPLFLDLGARFAVANNIPFIVYMHGKEIKLKGFKGKLADFYNSKLLPFALDHANAITCHTKKLFEQSILLKRYHQKIKFISAGVNEKKWNPEVVTSLKEELRLQNKKIIFTLGVLRDYKGLSYLMSAMRYVIKKHPDAILLIGGIGPLWKELHDEAKKYDLEDYVHFTGYVERVNEYFKIASVFVLASPDLREGFGLVAADAIAMEIPTIVTSGAGVSELFQEKKIGVVVHPKSDIALASAIISIFEMPPTRETLILWRKKLIEQNSWRVIAQEYLSLMQSIK